MFLSNIQYCLHVLAEMFQIMVIRIEIHYQFWLWTNGVSVHSVLRVDNRLLTSQFNAAVRGWLERNDEEGEGIKRISYRNCLDYLFLVHESPQQLNVVCRDGFSTLTDNSSR